MKTRREFIRISASGGAGFVLAIAIPGTSRGASHARPAAKEPEEQPFRPNAWVRIAVDGRITIVVGKQEMGQGVRTALPMIVAEELDAPWESIAIEQASTGPEYPRLNTGGSGSTQGSWKPLRQAGAVARAMLLTAAANRWGVDAGTLRTENGFVIDDLHARRASYGELAAAASKLPVPSDVRLKPVGQFRIVGKRTRRVDDPGIVTGRAKYGLDQRVPGMRFATIVRPPVIGARAGTIDDAKARRVRGIREVVPISSGVAIVADSTWPALKAQPLVEVTWDESAANRFDSENYIEQGLGHDLSDAVSMRAAGDAASALTGAARVVEAKYVYPFYAHAALEPMNCVASVRDGACLQYRLDHLGGAERVKAGELTLDRPRLRHVLEAVRDRSDWGKPLAAGRGRGTACNIYDGDSCLAYVVEATVRAKSWHVDRVVCAVDAGLIVNPIGVEQQIEGGVVWALTQLMTEITIRNGRVEQTNYHDFEVPRIGDAPQVEIHILPSESEAPLGIGEPPVPPFAPAVCSALFAATGQRMRRLPVRLT